MEHRRSFLSTLGLGSAALASGQTSSAKDPTIDIFQSAYQGDIPRATELAKLNPAIARLRSPDGRTPLHYAVEGGQTDMIFFLTMRGADLSAGPESPLLAAVGYPDHALALEMSQTLLMNASDPNARRADGRSALDLAISRGYGDVAELLVHRGANGTGADAIIVERVHFGRRYSFDIEGRPYQPEDVDGLPQDFINDFTRLAHFDADRVKHLMKIAPGLIDARATWDELGIEAAAHMGLVALARHLADHGARYQPAPQHCWGCGIAWRRWYDPTRPACGNAAHTISRCWPTLSTATSVPTSRITCCAPERAFRPERSED